MKRPSDKAQPRFEPRCYRSMANHAIGYAMEVASSDVFSMIKLRLLLTPVGTAIVQFVAVLHPHQMHVWELFHASAITYTPFLTNYTFTITSLPILNM